MTIEDVPGIRDSAPSSAEEAVERHRRELALLAGLPGEHARRARLYLELGSALRSSGDTVGAREAFLDAARQARSVGDVDLLAEAAFGYGLGAGGLHRSMRCDLQQIALLEEGLAALGPGDSPVRARLLARLAEELYFTPEDVSRSSLAAEAVAMAKRLRDRHVLLSAKYARELCQVGPDLPLSERLDTTGELVQLAEELGEGEYAYLGHMLRELVLTEAGRLVEAARELDAAEAHSDDLRIPGLQAWALSARARQAWLAGRFDEAEQLNGAAMQRALEQGGDPEVASLVVGGQYLAHQLLRTELGQFVPALEAYRDDYPHLPVLRCFLAYAHADSGRLDEAARVLADLSPNGVVAMARTTDWSAAMWALAGVVHRLGDLRLASVVHAELVPLSGRWFADWASTCLGPVDTALARVSITLGDAEDACRYAERGLGQAVAAPSPPWVADAQVAYAEALALRAAPGDVERARGLRVWAARTCEELGMAGLGARARELVLG